MSVREARAGFAAAIAAAERGEKVVITKYGHPVAELVPPRTRPKRGWNWNEFDRVHRQLALPECNVAPDEIDWDADHAWSREVLGMADLEDQQP